MNIISTENGLIGYQTISISNAPLQSNERSGLIFYLPGIYIVLLYNHVLR